MKVVSMHQPAYLPWMGYLHKVLLSDEFIVLDATQFEKNSFINRNKVRTAQGWTWLTIPILTKEHLNKTITEMEWDSTAGWQRKHLETLRQSYARAPHFDRYFADVRMAIEGATDFTTLLVDMLRFFAHELGASTAIRRATELTPVGRKSDLVLKLCETAGADVYVSGALGAEYLDRDAFAKAGIDVRVQQYQHPTYAQLHEPFEPYMGIVDCLFNHGGSQTAELIMHGNTTRVELLS